MHIGERIKLKREELGLSQEELAKKLGYKSRSSINKVELGINDITQRKVVEFANALQTTPAYLMGWEDDTNIIQKNDTIADIILRLESDDDFLEITKLLYKSSVEQLNTFKTILLALEQQNVD